MKPTWIFDSVSHLSTALRHRILIFMSVVCSRCVCVYLIEPACLWVYPMRRDYEKHRRESEAAAVLAAWGFVVSGAEPDEAITPSVCVPVTVAYTWAPCHTGRGTHAESQRGQSVCLKDEIISALTETLHHMALRVTHSTDIPFCIAVSFPDS